MDTVVLEDGECRRMVVCQGRAVRVDPEGPDTEEVCGPLQFLEQCGPLQFLEQISGIIVSYV